MVSFIMGRVAILGEIAFNNLWYHSHKINKGVVEMTKSINSSWQRDGQGAIRDSQHAQYHQWQYAQLVAHSPGGGQLHAVTARVVLTLVGYNHHSSILCYHSSRDKSHEYSQGRYIPCILFDYSTSHSFIDQNFQINLKLTHEVLRIPLNIYSQVGRAIVFIQASKLVLANV